MNLKQIPVKLESTSTKLKVPKELKLKIRKDIETYKLMESLITVFVEAPLYVIENLIKEKGGDNLE